MLRAILNRSWRQHPAKQQLYGQVRQTRHARHCWRSRDELISEVLLWTPSHGRAKAERPPRTYCEDTGCSPEDLPDAMYYKERWRERVKVIRADDTARWWWWGGFGYFLQFGMILIPERCRQWRIYLVFVV